MRRVPLMLIGVLALAGCSGEEFEKPSEVRVARTITMNGDRIISYTAMYDDGVETYIDVQPHGSLDIVTVERESFQSGELVFLGHSGATGEVEGEEIEIGAFGDEWVSKFKKIDSMVNVEEVPWSDPHTGMTPAELDALGGG